MLLEIEELAKDLPCVIETRGQNDKIHYNPDFSGFMMLPFLIILLAEVLQDTQFWGHTVPVATLYDEHIQTMTIAVVILDLKGDNDGNQTYWKFNHSWHITL